MPMGQADNALALYGPGMLQLEASHESVLVAAPFGPWTLTLPPLSDRYQTQRIAKIDTGPSITIQGYRADTSLDGTASWVLSEQGDFIELFTSNAAPLWVVVTTRLGGAVGPLPPFPNPIDNGTF